MLDGVSLDQLRTFIASVDRQLLGSSPPSPPCSVGRQRLVAALELGSVCRCLIAPAATRVVLLADSRGMLFVPNMVPPATPA